MLNPCLTQIHVPVDILTDEVNIQLSIYGNAIELGGQATNVTYKVFAYNQSTGVKHDHNVLYSLLLLDKSRFVAQPANGIAFNPGEFVTFSVNVTSPTQTVS